MHKTHAVNSWLLWLAVLLPWGSMAADPPPPLVRSPLTTNVAPFGATGQALFRTTASPYLDWSNTVNADGVTNLVQSKSNFIVSAHGTLNVSNDAVFGTNKLLITTNGNVWKKGMIVSDFGLAVGTNTAAMWGYWPDEATTSSAFESFRDTDKEYPFNELALGLKSGLGSGLFCGFGTEMNQNGAGFFLQATTNINTSSYFWVDLNNGSNATYQTKFYMKHLGTNLFWMGEGGDWTNRGFHVSRDIISSNSLTVKGEQTNSGGIHFTNVTMPGGGDSGIGMVNNTNLVITNGASAMFLNTNGAVSFGTDYTSVTHFSITRTDTHPDGRICLRTSASADSYIGPYAGYYFDIFDANLEPMLFRPFGVECMRIAYPSGNIGLGTNSPQSREHVTADNSVPYIAQWGTTNRPQLMTLDTNGGLNVLPAASSITNVFQIVGTNGIGLGHDVVVDSMGRVGVGTNMPQALVDIQGTNAGNGYLLRVGTANVANGTNAFSVDSNSVTRIYRPDSTMGLLVRGDSVGMRIGADAATAKIAAVDSTGLASYKNFEFTGTQVGFTHTAGGATHMIVVNGNTGIGTTAPPTKLTVTYDNSVANGIQWGSTNKPQQGTVSTNGVLSVNPGGGLNQVGVYGSLMMNATNIIVCAAAASVYTNVAGTGFTTIVTNGFFGNTAAIVAGLTNLYAGWYRVTICASALGANNQATEWEIVTNGVACDLIGMKKTYDAAARMDDLSMTGIVYLPANCGTQFMVQDGGTGGSIAIHRASLTIGTP